MKNRLAGIRCLVVRGYFKSSGEVITCELNSSNTTTWNIVELDGLWYHVDCFLGSVAFMERNFLSETERADKEPDRKILNECHFLTNASLFIYSHFPLNDKFQLLARKVTLDEFRQITI